VFQVVDRPQRLVMSSTMTMPDGSSVETELEITLEEMNGKTRMTIVQSGFPTAESRDAFESGWPGALERLEGVVRARVSGSRLWSGMS
jgi:Activator of Hsp90 ATPase homolog 1-like protein